MKRKGKGRNNPTLVNIEPLCLARAKPTCSKKMKMEKVSFHSIRTWKNSSSLLRYSQINGFAMSLQQKVRVRFPKLLDVKNPTQKTEKGGPKGKNKMIKWAKPAQLLPKEIGSIFSNGSRNKKPLQNSKNDINDNADALNDCTEEERDALIVSRKKGSKFKSLLEDSVEGLTLSRSCSFKKIMRIIDTKGKQMKKKDEATSETSTGTRKQPRILFRNLSGLKFRFRTRVRFRFNNGKTNKADTGTDFEGADYVAVKNAETGKMSKTISWASIRRPTGYCIIRSMKSIHKRMMKQGRECKHEDGDEQEKVELELCKKRILMGDKCRPLSASGSLHYDQNGILLPEVLPYQEL
ncbi:uncharacterized protein LOC107772263 [Nicotiana tabacum]|uniref:Uncharacterized protein LOC107772263 n=1 Tax=Nicotiana tabacum TaxID=4097 RepID=A0A1S3Y5S7_TOBAC|nr:PREDICTED: uncharacterized protein LOC107772263 [Nicotiana tabacum]